MIKTIYDKEVDVQDLDINFYPQDESCLVIIDVVNKSPNKIKRLATVLYSNLHSILPDKTFYVLPILSTLNETQRHMLPLFDTVDTNEFLVVDVIDAGLLWDIVITDKDLVDLSLERLVIPLPKEEE